MTHEKLWEPGDRLERWLVLKRFMGAWGVVYLLRDLSYEGNASRPAVLIGKTLRPEWSTDQQQIKRFEQEAYAWLSLGIHKHIVRLFSVDRFLGQVFAFGEYVPQILLPNTLRGWIESHLIELEVALRFGVQICRALSYARSRGVLIHQDLKPENIMVTSDGVVKVTDWGLSQMKPPPASGLSSVGDIPYRPDAATQVSGAGGCGTPGYAAPELSTAEKPLTPQADMFSLGVLLIEMISGRRPAVDAQASEVMNLFRPLSPPVRARMADAISACLSSSPDKRPDSPDVVENVLKEAFGELVGVPVEAPPGKSWETGADRGQRAYALFMLGRIDEAMKLQAELARGYGPKKEKVTEEKEPAGEKVKLPVVVMDYKERGWKYIIPTDLLLEAEKRLASSPDDQELLNEALELNYMGGRFERAIELCLVWLRREPESHEALTRMSKIYARQKEWREALNYLDRALALRPSDAEGWLQRSTYCENGGDLEGALRSAQKAAALAPESEDARLRYGHLLAESENYQAALQEFQEVTRINPESAPALYNVGTCWNRMGRPDLAYQFMMQAVEKDPKFAIAFNSLAAIAMQAHAFQEALIFLERAIAADPSYARPWFNKAQVLELLRKFEEARQAYLTALHLNPNYELARAGLEKLETEHLL